MNQLERREAIKQQLELKRCTQVGDLADMFGISVRTIKYDLEAITCSYPIETVRGRYGCIRLAEWYHPEQSRLCARQLQLLISLRDKLRSEELIILNSIISQFSP